MGIRDRGLGIGRRHGDAEESIKNISPCLPCPPCPRQVLQPTVYTQVKIFHIETVSRLELKFQAHSESPLHGLEQTFFESSSEDLRYETRNLFRDGTDALNLDLCVHRRPPQRTGSPCLPFPSSLPFTSYNFLLKTAANWTVKVEPWAGLLLTEIEPPHPCSSCCTIVRPKPAPPGSSIGNGRTR